jgi:hypothetical protein
MDAATAALDQPGGEGGGLWQSKSQMATANCGAVGLVILMVRRRECAVSNHETPPQPSEGRRRFALAYGGSSESDSERRHGVKVLRDGGIAGEGLR